MSNELVKQLREAAEEYYGHPELWKLLTKAADALTGQEGAAPSVWHAMEAHDGSTGHVLLRFPAGPPVVAYLTEDCPPMVRTWRYASGPGTGAQAPWPVGWAPLPREGAAQEPPPQVEERER